MGIEKRLQRLEGGECVLCGSKPSAAYHAYHVEWDHDLEEGEEVEEPEYCPVCGSPDTIVIRWPEDLP